MTTQVSVLSPSDGSSEVAGAPPHPALALVPPAEVAALIAERAEDFSSFGMAEKLIQAIYQVSARLPSTQRWAAEFTGAWIDAMIAVMPLTAVRIETDHGQHIVFEDLTWLHVEEGELLLESQEVEEYEGCAFSDLARVPADPVDPAFSLVDASAGFLAQHGSIDAWLADERSVHAAKVGAGEDEENPGGGAYLVSVIMEAVEDIVDPEMDFDDFIDTENWEQAEVDALEEKILVIAKASGLSGTAGITISSCWDKCPATVDIFCSSSPQNEGVATMIETAIRALEDLDRFEGAYTEYNDGAHDRRSGYSDYPKTVVDIEFDGDEFSAHDRLAARKELRAMLTEAGKSPEEIEAILSPEVSEQPTT